MQYDDGCGDADSDGTEGSERMRAARDWCSEGEDSANNTGSSCSDEDDGALFPSDVEDEDPSDEDDAPPELWDLPDPDLPRPSPAGYLFIDPGDLRTRFARITEFRGQRSCRCYKYPRCSWILPRYSPITTFNLVRWALEGLKPEVVTWDDHMALRAKYSLAPGPPEEPPK